MNQAQYALWVANLPACSKEQLDDLLSRVKLLSKTAGKGHSGKQDFGERVLVTICDVLKKNNAETPSPNTLKKSSAYVSAKDKLQDLANYFDNISKSKLVQDRILKEAVSLLYVDLLNWQGIAISSHTIIKQIHRIPATLNKHFPGYAASGLLTKIVKVDGNL